MANPEYPVEDLLSLSGQVYRLKDVKRADTFASAVIEQVEKLQHATTMYLHPNFPDLAAKLSAKMPDGLDVTYFTNSGSEANELAVAMARMYTGHEDVVAVRNAYHGGTATAMGLTSHSTWKFQR